MQTNARLLTDRNLIPTAGRPLPRLGFPDADAAGVFEALAHTALVLILLGALFFSGRHQPAVTPAGEAVLAPAAVHLSPGVAETSPASASVVKCCL